MGSPVAISRTLLDAILADVRRDPARERCGLLLGDTQAILDFAPTANIHATPERHFEIDPAALIAAYRAERSGGLAVVGHYHSHPVSEATPSVADAEAADTDGRLWLIISRDAFGLWRSVAEGPVQGRFDRVDLRVSPQHGDMLRTAATAPTAQR